MFHMFYLFSFHTDFYLIVVEVEFRYCYCFVFLLVFALVDAIKFMLAFLFIFHVSPKITEHHLTICRYFST